MEKKPPFEKGDIITFKRDQTYWGTVVSFSDDGSIVYYMPCQGSVGLSAAKVEDVMLDWCMRNRC